MQMFPFNEKLDYYLNCMCACVCVCEILEDALKTLPLQHYQQQPCSFTLWGGGLVAKTCLTLATPQTVALQVPPSVGFPRQEYWSMLPFHSFTVT